MRVAPESLGWIWAAEPADLGSRTSRFGQQNQQIWAAEPADLGSCKSAEVAGEDVGLYVH